MVHLRMYHTGEIAFCENLDIVLFWWLVVVPRTNIQPAVSDLRRTHPPHHARLFEGYSDPVLGAVTPCLSTFGAKCPGFPKNVDTLTF
jgi:hypothetical protein